VGYKNFAILDQFYTKIFTVESDDGPSEMQSEGDCEEIVLSLDMVLTPD